MHDTEATKNMYEIEYSYIKENSISGVIREISSSPFGFIFMSQIQVLKYFKKTLNFYFILNWIYFQVNIWKFVQNSNPIWFFDSAGLFLQKKREQNDPLLYSIAIHDSQNRVILPLAEFHTTNHTASNIETYLIKIKNLLNLCLKNSSSFIFPKIAVVDHSLPLLYAICSQINSCQLSTYLKWSYDYLLGFEKANFNKVLNVKIIFKKIN